MAAVSDFRSGFPSVSCNSSEFEKTERNLKKAGYYILDMTSQDGSVDFRYCDLRQGFLCPERHLENAVHYFNERGITVTQGVPCEIPRHLMLSLEKASGLIP
ncbi:hypothetical protein [Estrella lausannensis]|uniref:Uncharacterized protein n=1 Tax=Estrella lausannensis TaxID=483423 RepID=A0A0H5DRA0_9BACT|nr:hypothetical protein [Estrella lausannensis]CRX38189.1 hypothetical protein ELAC_0840 [Estrella lausannensis]